jgi:hypothetical protein
VAWQLTAAMASAPAGGALTFPAAPASAAAPAAAAVTATPLALTRQGAADGLTEAIRSNVAASRLALTAVARNASVLQAAAQRAAASRAAARKAAAAVASKQAARAAAPLACDTSQGMLPANVTAIVSFLLAHGYSRNAVAGMAGNIYRESMGDPESVGTGGGGLIGWTPLPSGFVTGSPAADLQTQLAAILTYNQGWAQYIPVLNAASTPAAAADIYVTDFERAGIPAAGQREASAVAVASACGL